MAVGETTPQIKHWPENVFVKAGVKMEGSVSVTSCSSDRNIHCKNVPHTTDGTSETCIRFWHIWGGGETFGRLVKFKDAQRSKLISLHSPLWRACKTNRVRGRASRLLTLPVLLLRLVVFLLCVSGFSFTLEKTKNLRSSLRSVVTDNALIIDNNKSILSCRHVLFVACLSDMCKTYVIVQKYGEWTIVAHLSRGRVVGPFYPDVDLAPRGAQCLAINRGIPRAPLPDSSCTWRVSRIIWNMRTPKCIFVSRQMCKKLFKRNHVGTNVSINVHLWRWNVFLYD